MRVKHLNNYVYFRTNMEKWADYLISAVRYNPEHTRIIKVREHEDLGDKVGQATEVTRQEVISKIKQGKKYMTIFRTKDGKWKRGEEVHILTIDGEEFIRTDANKIKADNLGNLPEF